MWESRDPFLEFWDLSNISRTVEARRFKLGTETEGSEFQRIKCKINSKGVMWGSRDPVLEFVDVLISHERLKLETSNMAVSSNKQNAKLGQKGSCWGHVTQFWNLGTPYNISRTVEARKFKLGTDTESSEFQRIKCKINSKRVMWGSRDAVSEFWEPPNISRTVKARKFKFGTYTDGSEF